MMAASEIPLDVGVVRSQVHETSSQVGKVVKRWQPATIISAQSGFRAGNAILPQLFPKVRLRGPVQGLCAKACNAQAPCPPAACRTGRVLWSTQGKWAASMSSPVGIRASSFPSGEYAASKKYSSGWRTGRNHAGILPLPVESAKCRQSSSAVSHVSPHINDVHMKLLQYGVLGCATCWHTSYAKSSLLSRGFTGSDRRLRNARRVHRDPFYSFVSLWHTLFRILSLRHTSFSFGPGCVCPVICTQRG